MACTSQSAVEYIRNARTHLVGGLQNLSVIVENLYQRRVFTNEQVSEINSEKTDFDKTRTILDLVTNKGEAASYELLVVIYITRKRTFLSDKVGHTSTQKANFDLHHWISCFSFKDDVEIDINYSKGPRPCHRYQKKLRSKALELSEDVWKQSNRFLGPAKDTDSYLSYTPLVLDTHENTPNYKIIMQYKSKKCKKPRPKKMKTYIPLDKQELSVDDLLKTHENKILLVGKPGIGKTTAACQMLKIWGGRDNNDLDYMFYYDMREMSCFTNPKIEDLLFTFSEPDEGKEEVLKDIKRNSENVTIIFDGLTDLPSSSMMKTLLKGCLRMLPDAKIVITCRPEVESENVLFDWASLRVEVKGFSKKSISAYLAKMLNKEQLNNVENNLELFSLCHVPVYALMVVACFSFTNAMASEVPCTVSEIYIHIFRGCIQEHGGKAIPENELDNYIRDCSKKIFDLAKAALQATREKSVNLKALSCEESCVRSAFLKTFRVQVAPTERNTHSAFLHYAMQEFFTGLWFLKNPEKITDLLQQCCTEEMKHMKHVIPFLCGLCSPKNHDRFKYLAPDLQAMDISKSVIRDVVNTFLLSPLNQDQDDTDDSNILFLCQCLYESQSTDACLHFLDKLDYCLDLREEELDPHHYCAVSYVISQAQERKVKLQIEDSVSAQGLKLVLGCLKNVQLDGCYTVQSQLWKALLLSEEEMDYRGLLELGGNELHLPVGCGKRQVFERAVEVMQKNSPERVNLCLLWDRKTSACQDLRWTLLESLPHISTLRYTSSSKDTQVQEQFPVLLDGEEKQLLLDLCLEAAIKKREVFQSSVNRLLSLFSVYTMRYDILLDLYLHISNKGYKHILPILKPLYPSAPTVWSIDLSERKASVLLECLKLQPEKKPVELRGWSDEENEVKSFLQCLPYISKLSFTHEWPESAEQGKFLGKLICEAAEQEEGTGEKILELFYSVCNYKTFPYIDWRDIWVYRFDQCDILLHLYSYVKNYETKTGRSVLPALQPVYQSVPAVWSIWPPLEKFSLLLEVLKLQPEKKPVELCDVTDEESEVRMFLQCLPYISQLSFRFTQERSERSKQGMFLGKLICEAAAQEEETGEQILELFCSVCNYKTFPYIDWLDIWVHRLYQCDILLHLYSYVKNYETQTGRSVLPALQPVYQSLPAVWSMYLSETKVSLLLEVLKLQPEKKPVELCYCTDEESEVKMFLQCLPYISQLSFTHEWPESAEQGKFLGKLICEAAEQEEGTGEKILELFYSVCNYKTFPYIDWRDIWVDRFYQCDILLHLYSYVKNYETKTGRSVLPALQPVYQSVPAVWSIWPPLEKASLLLEVLKLQPEKKPVELCGVTVEESEVRMFLQCLPYISQLSFRFTDKRSDRLKQGMFLGKLICEAAAQEEETGEQMLELIYSVCNYKTFPYIDWDDNWAYRLYQCDILLHLYSYVKSYETKTGRSVLPALQPVYQSVPAVWSIWPPLGKFSLLLEVLKLQPEKKPVELCDDTDEESEVRMFLQCLPYISQLRFRFTQERSERSEQGKFLGKLICEAAQREEETGERILELFCSVCNYKTFPYIDRLGSWVDRLYQCDILLLLYSYVKNYEAQTGRSVLPALQPVYQSLPAVWSIYLSQTKVSLLLEVLKLQPEKKPVELCDDTDEESEVRMFLQCLPYISQLSFRFTDKRSDRSKQGKFLGKLICEAAEREEETGEQILELFYSVCNYKTFPFIDWHDAWKDRKYQCDILLHLYSYVKNYETKTGRSVLPALQLVYQSLPTVWSIDLSRKEVSLLLEVLKLQPEKKPVELRGRSDEENELRLFLQCLPYISQLRCGPGFFQHTCESITVTSREEVDQLVSLLHLLDFTLLLRGELLTNICKTVGKVLELCGSSVDLVLRPSKISLEGVSLLFRHATQIQRLGLSERMVLLLFRLVRTGRLPCPVAIEELSILKTTPQSERLLSRVVSNVASLLRHWTVRCLDLAKSNIHSNLLLPMLSHHDQLTIKLCPEVLQELAGVVFTAQDKDLTKSFLEKVGGELTSCSLNWEVLLYLLQQSSAQMFTVDLRKSRIAERSITCLSPFLERVVFKRPSPSFVLCAIRETYTCQSSDCMPSLLRSLDYAINLNNRELDTVDCDALFFTLTHCDKVTELSLLWTSIPPEAIESILFSLDKVSHVSVDRSLLLTFLHCCTTCQTQQGAAAASLLRALQYRLDLSCSSSVDLSEQQQVVSLSLTVTHCMAISTVLRHSSRNQDTQLILSDCEVEDSGLDLLFPILNRVHLRASKSLLLQLLSLVSVGSERNTVMRAGSLTGALGGELDLSETRLDQKACRCLALVLEHSEGLTELDLSHCQLTDQLLEMLLPHLHKAQVLDLSHNKLTDSLTDRLLQLLSFNTAIQTVRLFNNCFMDRTPFLKDKRFDMW